VPCVCMTEGVLHVCACATWLAAAGACPSDHLLCGIRVVWCVPMVVCCPYPSGHLAVATADAATWSDACLQQRVQCSMPPCCGVHRLALWLHRHQAGTLGRLAGPFLICLATPALRAETSKLPGSCGLAAQPSAVTAWWCCHMLCMVWLEVTLYGNRVQSLLPAPAFRLMCTDGALLRLANCAVPLSGSLSKHCTYKSNETPNSCRWAIAVAQPIPVHSRRCSHRRRPAPYSNSMQQYNGHAGDNIYTVRASRLGVAGLPAVRKSLAHSKRLQWCDLESASQAAGRCYQADSVVAEAKL
jgi:hypothetical protein